jgi:hypothetical protein
MIDLIKMRKTGLQNINEIIEKNRLSINYRGNVIFYDNLKTKDIIDGFYIRVENGNPSLIRIECNLQKYWSGLNTGKFTNFGLFTFSESQQAINALSIQTGLNLNEFRVTYYEIGLNLNVKKDCRAYMDKMKSIGTIDKRKELLINPRYKDKRVIISEFYEEIKKVFKVYDKNFEMVRKRSKHKPLYINTLRIEIIQKRVERLNVSNLFDFETIKKLSIQFFNNWRTVQFEKNIETPKGTHESKVLIIKDLLTIGRKETLEKALNEFKTGIITERRYRTVREFIQNDWELFKNEIKLIQSEEEKEFKSLINTASVLFLN